MSSHYEQAVEILARPQPRSPQSLPEAQVLATLALVDVLRDAQLDTGALGVHIDGRRFPDE